MTLNFVQNEGLTTNNNPSFPGVSSSKNIPRERQRPVASHRQTLSLNVVQLVLIEIRTYNISGDRH